MRQLAKQEKLRCEAISGDIVGPGPLVVGGQLDDVLKEAED